MTEVLLERGFYLTQANNATIQINAWSKMQILGSAPQMWRIARETFLRHWKYHQLQWRWKSVLCLCHTKIVTLLTFLTEFITEYNRTSGMNEAADTAARRSRRGKTEMCQPFLRFYSQVAAFSIVMTKQCLLSCWERTG